MTKRKPYPKGAVCKPCWELKYCPYGPLVEYFPGPGGGWTVEEAERQHKEALATLLGGKLESEDDVWDAIGALHYTRPHLFEALESYESEDVQCKIFGHSCPVFFTQSGATETADCRPEGRYIPREVMLKVVRRDNHVCQACHGYVPDDQVEFDHVIPFSKGGATTVQNLRLLCRTCNRKKSNSMDGLLRKWEVG